MFKFKRSAKATTNYPEVPPPRSTSRLDDLSDSQQQQQQQQQQAPQQQRGPESYYRPSPSEQPDYPDPQQDYLAPRLDVSSPLQDQAYRQAPSYEQQTFPPPPPGSSSYDSSPVSQTANSGINREQESRKLKKRLYIPSSSRENVAEYQEENSNRFFKRKPSVKRTDGHLPRPQEQDRSPLPPPRISESQDSQQYGPSDTASSSQELTARPRRGSHQLSLRSALESGPEDEQQERTSGNPPRSPLHQVDYHPYRPAAHDSPHPLPPPPPPHGQQPRHTSSWPLNRVTSEEEAASYPRPPSQPLENRDLSPSPDPRSWTAERTIALREFYLTELDRKRDNLTPEPPTIPGNRDLDQQDLGQMPGQPPAHRELQQPGQTLRRESNDRTNNLASTPHAENNSSSSGTAVSLPVSQSAQQQTGETPNEQDAVKLMLEYRELRDKYSKVKRYYFEKDEQVKALQNSLAFQRLAQSRTVLDDGEYAARLQRLDGQISNLAFTHRKDWKVIPAWLHASVNKDAISIGKQEMTAVGRAFISNWLVEQVFEQYFHPALDPTLSSSLKEIQKNIRRSAPDFSPGSPEEDALIAKIIGWRLSTNDGLKSLYESPDAPSHRQNLVAELNAQLVRDLHEHMVSPPPEGLEGSVNMVIEIAVNILANVPFESREIQIEYYRPGHTLSNEIMDVLPITVIPPLTNAVAPNSERRPEVDKASIASNATDFKDAQADPPQHEDNESMKEHESTKSRGLFGSLMGGRKASLASPAGLPRNASASASTSSLGQQGNSGNATATAPAPKEDITPRARMALFLGAQVRGKNVLCKAPVITT